MQVLSTQQAADLLNVSRSHLLNLLGEGKLPFTRTGGHRRIRLEDAVAYKDRRDKQSLDAMDELAKQAQEQGMGY